MILTNYFIKKKIKRLSASHARREHTFRSLEEVRDIVLFFHIRDREEIEACMAKLRKAGKRVKGCVFVPHNWKGEVAISYLPVKHGVNLSALSMPSEQLLNELSELRMDMLMDLTSPRCVAMKYLFLHQDCPFKVGVKWDEEEYYDFSIAATDDRSIPYLFDQLVHYLQTIRST